MQQDLPFVEEVNTETTEPVVPQEIVEETAVVETASDNEAQQEINFTEQSSEEVVVEETPEVVAQEVSLDSEEQAQTEEETPVIETVATTEVEESKTPVETETQEKQPAVAINGVKHLDVALTNKTSGKATSPMAKPAPIELIESNFEIVEMDSEQRANVQRSDKSASRGFATSSSSAGPTKP